MQIQPSIIQLHSQVTQPENKVTSQDKNTSTLATPQTSVEISQAGQINQQIDTLFNEIDDLYLSHLSPAQRQELAESYQKLDDLFAQSQPDAPLSAAEEDILARIDDIFSAAESSFTNEELAKLEQLDDAIDSLFEQEVANQNIIFDEIEQLEDNHQQLVITSLTSQQKEELKTLNNTLDLLFKQQEFSAEDNKKIDELFQKINNIFDHGYDNLSEAKKTKVDKLSQSIEQLYEAMEFSE